MSLLTHWGWVTRISISKLTITGSDNGLSPGQHQAIIWTNAGILLIRIIGTNFSEILSEIHIFSFKKIRLKMSSGNWQPFCLGLNVLAHSGWDKMADFLQMTFWKRIQILQKFVHKGPTDNTSSLVQIIAWHHTGKKALFEPTMS